LGVWGERGGDGDDLLAFFGDFIDSEVLGFFYRTWLEVVLLFDFDCDFYGVVFWIVFFIEDTR
jgi:hypothetical protein